MVNEKILDDFLVQREKIENNYPKELNYFGNVKPEYRRFKNEVRKGVIKNDFWEAVIELEDYVYLNKKELIESIDNSEYSDIEKKELLFLVENIGT